MPSLLKRYSKEVKNLYLKYGRDVVSPFLTIRKSLYSFFIKLFIRFLKIKMIQYNKYIIKSHVMYSVARTAAEEASWPVITLYKAHSC